MPVVAAVPYPLVPESLEWLEQAVKLAGRNHRPGVGDPQHGPAGRRPGLDLGPAAGHVVPDRVADQVRHQAFRQPGVALGQRGGEPGVDRDVLGHGRRDDRQVEGLRAGDAAFAARHREQRVDQLLLLPAQPQDFVAGRAQGVGAGLRVAQRHLEHGPLGRQRGAQLVGGVGDEMPLRLERGLQPREQVVQRLAEPAELVIAAGGPQPTAQVGGRDVARGRDDRLQRPQQAPGEQPAEPERGRDRDRQGDERDSDLGKQIPAGMAGHRRRARSDVRRLAHREEREREHHQRQDEEHPPVQQRQPRPQRPGEHHASPIR